METLEYTTSFDNFSKGVTIGVILLLGSISYRSFKVLLGFKSLDSKSILIHSLVLIIMLSIIIVSYLWSPKKYILSDNQLIINKTTNNIVVDYKYITKVQLIKKEEMKGTIRTFGNGGLFGYYGKFHNPTFGNMNFQTTRQNNRVLIETKDNRKIIISPDDLNFINEINKRIN